MKSLKELKLMIVIDIIFVVMIGMMHQRNVVHRVLVDKLQNVKTVNDVSPIHPVIFIRLQLTIESMTVGKTRLCKEAKLIQARRNATAPSWRILVGAKK